MVDQLFSNLVPLFTKGTKISLIKFASLLCLKEIVFDHLTCF